MIITLHRRMCGGDGRSTWGGMKGVKIVEEKEEYIML
jgi:hypothetical protein